MLAKLTFAALLSVLSLPAMAQCDVTIEANDAMQFNTKEISIDKTCKEFTIKLEHTGKLPKNAMGHNVVISKKSDEKGIATDGMAAGLDNNYVKPDDPRVIAHTDVVGGGESTSVTFDVSKLSEGEDYAFFCSFPGHWAVMTGKVTLAG
ncbi:azurin [Allopusillimonas soli]|uniref:Azurin n=1 Tax=Allopusillimonas soli TaxID=659016 RepID=A0A853F7Y4_9BURK|nr:azurin [Allopusillimonas soli]NYT36724.1 azurin [Allopusillimonas soli]TEA75200.1 azurin [Allopusillimonas soli]